MMEDGAVAPAVRGRGSWWSQFGYQVKWMMWKNWMLKKRRPIGTLVEVLLPCVFMLFLVYARSKSTRETVPADFEPSITWDPLDNLPIVFDFDGPDAVNLGLVRGRNANEQTFLEGLVAAANATYRSQRYYFYDFNVAWYDSEAAMIEQHYEDDDSLTVGIVWKQVGSAANNWRWAYKIKLSYYDTPMTSQYIDTFSPPGFLFYGENYVNSGFVPLQDFIDQYVIQQTPTSARSDKNVNTTTVSAHGQRMPHPEYIKDDFQSVIRGVLPFLLMVTYMYPFSRLVRLMVEEKESRAREGLFMHGLFPSALWTSWFLTYLIIFGTSAIIITISMSPKVFQYTSTAVLFMYFFFFAVSTITLAALISVFFNKAKLAGSLSMVLFFICFVPYLALKQGSMSYGAKVLMCLLSPAAFGLASNTLSIYEGAQIGVHFSNWGEKTENFRFVVAIVMMLFDAVLYGVLAVYLDRVLPKEFGKRESPLFCLESKRKKRSNYMQLRDQSDNEPQRPNEFVEEVSERLKESLAQGHGIRVRGLCKTFETGDEAVKAVDHLDLEMYNGQCFSLLGHNGAGKTTALSCLTGLVEPTRGEAFINGLSIQDDMDEIRQSLGFCPQHDILFNELTVEEHLRLYCALRYMPEEDIPAAIADMLGKVGLLDKSFELSMNLSGGMKRKLSVAIALIGKSSVVFLDEPTAGMDPLARRATWNLIQEYKPNRVIVLTTHYLDEADYLGDRIAIMSRGRLRTCGSSMFLKSTFGVGYTFVLTKQAQGFKREAALALVRKHCPDLEIVGDLGSELSLRLPFSASRQFPELFDQLDESKDELGVRTYSVSVTTLEEVFLRVAMAEHVEERANDSDDGGFDEDDDDQKLYVAPQLPDQANNDSSSGTSKHVDDEDEEKRPLRETNAPVPGSNATFDGPAGSDTVPYNNMDASNFIHDSDLTYFFYQLKALFIKRALYALRDKKAMVFQFIIPIVALIVGLSVLQIDTGKYPNDLKMTTLQFPTPMRVPYNQDAITPFLASMTDASLERTMHPVALGGTDDTSLGLQKWLIGDDSKPHNYFGALFAAETDGDGVHAAVMYNATGVHALPTFLNLYHSAALRAHSGNGQAEIETYNHPFPLSRDGQKTIGAVNGILISLIVTLAFSFIPASYATFVVRERSIKFKHQQMLSGVSPAAYWLSMFAFDACSYLVTAGVCAVIFSSFQQSAFTGDNFGPTMLVFFLFGMSAISFAYLLSFLFDKPAAAQNKLLSLFVISGLVLLIMSFVMQFIPSTRDTNKTLQYVYRIFPSYCLGHSLFYLSIRRLPLVGKANIGPYDKLITGYDITYMVSETVVYFLIVLLIEFVLATPSLRRMFIIEPKLPLNPEEATLEDDDVKNEREKMVTGRGDRDTIRLHGLRKVFRAPGQSQPFAAVRDLHFSVPDGQCFAFLGTNGAGKTTTLSMLSGDLPPSAGDAFMAGHSVVESQLKVRRVMGYCPQDNALLPLLTGREHLRLYARVKGVASHALEDTVTRMICDLQLEKYADKAAKTYSGGNKRKLAVAIALIGGPRIVLLDEPSAGVDAVARRWMWGFIHRTMAGRSVILTTHSINEASNLCQRIGIMVGGTMRCLGSSEHLKSKYAQGYQLNVKTKPEDVARTIEFVRQAFGGSIREEHDGNQLYAIPRQQMSLGQMFRTVENAREHLGISDYSVSQTSLEQVFLFFAQQQLMVNQQRNYFAAGPQFDNGNNAPQVMEEEGLAGRHFYMPQQQQGQPQHLQQQQQQQQQQQGQAPYMQQPQQQWQQGQPQQQGQQQWQQGPASTGTDGTTQ